MVGILPGEKISEDAFAPLWKVGLGSTTTPNTTTDTTFETTATAAAITTDTTDATNVTTTLRWPKYAPRGARLTAVPRVWRGYTTTSP